MQRVRANLPPLALRAGQRGDEGGDELGANLEKMTGRGLTNTSLISDHRAAGAIEFIRRVACPPPRTLPHHVSGDEIEINNSRARVVCCSPDGQTQLSWLDIAENEPPGKPGGYMPTSLGRLGRLEGVRWRQRGWGGQARCPSRLDLGSAWRLGQRPM